MESVTTLVLRGGYHSEVVALRLSRLSSDHLFWMVFGDCLRHILREDLCRSASPEIKIAKRSEVVDQLQFGCTCDS